MALRQGVNGFEMYKNLAQGWLSGFLGKTRPRVSGTAGASALPAVKLKRGEKAKIKGEQEVKRRQKGAFRAPFMQLASPSTSQGS